jgi:hypothetical protein
MRILDDPSEPYGCEYCLEAFYYKTECRDHEAACSERDMELSGFQIEDLT